MAGKGILQIKVMGDSSHLEASLKKVVGAVAGLAIFKQVADYMVEAGKAAAEEDQQMQQLSKALQDNAGVTKAQYGEVEKWIAATQRATATADGELRPALLKLSSTTKDVGQAQDILSTALDISKARGLDLNTVVVAMEKAYQGNVGGLQRLGIATKDAEGNTLSFEQVMKNANETYGGAAQEAANTTAGRMQNLSLTLADLKETVGMALLPVIEKFTGFIMDNMPAIEKIMVGFADLVGAALNVLSDTVFPILQSVFEAFTGSVADKTPGTNTLFQGIGTVVEALKAVFERVWPLIWGTVDMFIQFIAGPTGQALINTLLEGIGTVLETLCKVFERVWPIIQTVVQAFIDFFNSPSGQKLISSLLGLVSTAVDLVLAAFNACWPVLEGIVKIFTNFFGGSNGSSFIVDLAQNVIDIVNKILAVFTEVFSAIGPVIKPLVEGIVIIIGGIVSAVKTAIEWLDKLAGRQELSDAQREAVGAVGGYTGAGGAVINKGDEAAYNAAYESSMRDSYQGSGGRLMEYAEGGLVSAPLGVPVHAIVHGHETVATAGQTSAIERLIPVLARLASGGIGGGVVFNITGQGVAAGQAAADTFLQRVAAAGVRL